MIFTFFNKQVRASGRKFCDKRVERVLPPCFSHFKNKKKGVEALNSMNWLSGSFNRNQYLNTLLELFHINVILITKPIKNTLTLITFR